MRYHFRKSGESKPRSRLRFPVGWWKWYYEGTSSDHFELSILALFLLVHMKQYARDAVADGA